VLSKNHKRLLKQLKLDYIKRAAPGFFEASGGYEMGVKPYKDDTANGLTRCCEDFINHLPNGIGEASRINSTGTPRKMASGEIRWSKSNTRKGLADIRATVQGRSISIEIKIGPDKQSEAQKKEEERITRSGGIYWVVKSFAHFLEQWEAAGFEVPAFGNVIQNQKA
jgi:hypothetical protein